jgi:probable addiction module antidote protein
MSAMTKTQTKLKAKPRIPKARARSKSVVRAKTRTVPFDVAEHLRTPEEMALYIDACIAESDGDAAFVAKALGDVARAQGMSKVARDAELSRESLYKALSGERSPDFATILKVTRALGMKLHAAAA